MPNIYIAQGKISWCDIMFCLDILNTDLREDIAKL